MAVYFIQEGGPDGPIKIGTGFDPRARLGKLQTGNSRELVLLATAPGGRAEEAALHVRFAAVRLERGEWFEPVPELLGYISGVLAACPQPRPVNAENDASAGDIFGIDQEQLEAICGYLEARDAVAYAIGAAGSNPPNRAAAERCKSRLQYLLREAAGSRGTSYEAGLGFGLRRCAAAGMVANLDEILAALGDG